MMRSAVLLLALVGAMTSCAQYGGRPVNVSIDSYPAGAEVFLVPMITWDTRGGEALLTELDSLQRFRIGGTQVTPFNTRVSYTEQVLIMKWKDGIAWTPVTPDEGARLFLQMSSGRQ